MRQTNADLADLKTNDGSWMIVLNRRRNEQLDAYQAAVQARLALPAQDRGDEPNKGPYAALNLEPERRNQVPQRQAFNESRTKLCDDIIANITSRFPRVELLEAMQV